MIDRRSLIIGGAALLAGCVRGPAGSDAVGPDATGSADADFTAIRATLGPGDRLGVAALDTGTRRRIGFDADGRYAMTSTFKAPLAAAVLAAVDRGALALDAVITFGPADLLSYAPVVRANLASGRLTVRQLCAAAVEVSDNSAANLLLARIGGPAGLTRFMRAAGDPATRLDRNEPDLNANIEGDPRDTTTPTAMVGLLQAMLVGDVLTPASRALLIGWMESSSTGGKRLRAGLPAGWRAGDKTGTGARGATNDIAIAWPPGRAPILIACYQSGGTAEAATRELAHARVAALVATRLG